MSCNLVPEIIAYLEIVESEEVQSCPEQKALATHIRKVFETEDLFIDKPRLEKYLSLQKYFTFRLFPWEEFLICLWLCTYKAPGVPRWKTLFGMLGRGAGKDGFIAFTSFCLLSPYNPIPHYDIDICANNEEQAVTPVEDVVEVLDSPKYRVKLNKHYYHTKQLVQGRRYKGKMRGRTNNPKSRDGMRSGAIIFNEVHQFENYDNIKVFKTGQGKTAEPRQGIFTSNGDVNDGPLDDYLARSNRILFEGEDDKGFLPFVCRLPNKEAVHDPANWHMANPSLQYLPHLLRETEEEYHEWLDNPEQNGDFLTKRMGIRAGFKEISVTDYEKIKATNKPVPDLTGWTCTVGLDYAELNDWASVNFHFKKGTQRYDINYTWVCMQSKTLPRVNAPWKDWAEKGYITVVNDVSISPELLAACVYENGKKYHIKKLAMDNFRWTLVSEAFKKIGFDAADKNKVKLVRPQDIMQIEPVIQECFDRGLFNWGEQPQLRWAVNNTKRVRSSKKIGVDTGNYIYAKIEGKSRKTDPFMALVASITIESEIGTGAPIAVPPIGAVQIK